MCLKRSLSLSLLIAFSALCIQTYAGEEPAKPVAKKTDQGKKNWIDIELDFAARLSLDYQYENLSKNVVERVKSGTGWDNKPLTTDQLNYLRSRMASMKVDVAMKLPELKDKLTKADEAIQELTAIMKELPKGPLKQEARVALVDGYFRLIAAFRKERDARMLQALIDGKGPGKGAEATNKVMALMPSFNAAKRKYFGMKARIDKYKKKKELSNGEENALLKLVKQIKKVKADYEKAEVAYKKALAEAGSDAQAVKYLGDGMKAAGPLLEELTDAFDVAIEAFQEAPPSKQKQLQAKTIAAFMRLVKLQHQMEQAYSNWTQLLDRNTPASKALCQKAQDVYDEFGFNYDDYMPADKQLWMHWMTVLGQLDDPIGEKGKDGKPLPKLDAENDEVGDYMRYLWPSVRLKFFFQKHFVADPPEGVPPTSNVMKIKAIYYYGEALMNMAFGAFDRAQKTTGPNKDAWNKHGAALLKDAQAALDQLIKPTTTMVGGELPVDQTTRLTTRLRLRSKLALRKAILAHQLGDEEKTRQGLVEALNECSQVITQGGPAWRYHAEKVIQQINGAAEAWNMELQSTATLLTEARELERQYRKEVVPAKRNQLIKEAVDKYTQVMHLIRNKRGKAIRAGTALTALSKIGINSLRVDDFLTGYIANFEVVQEFGVKDYPRDTYPSVSAPYETSVKNLRYAAGRLRRLKNTDYYKRLYVDALLLNIARQEDSGGGNPDVVVILINELKGLKLYEQALEYIDEVPADHVYYRTVILMAAGVCQNLMKQHQAALAKLPDPENPTPGKALPQGEALEKLKAKRAEHQKAIDGWAEKAVARSKQFIALMDKRPELPKQATDKQKKTYQDEEKNLPAAYMIPIGIAFTGGKYTEVIAMANRFATVLDEIKGLSKEDKEVQLTSAYYLAYIASLRLKDRKTAPLEEVWKQLEGSEAFLAKLAEVDNKVGEMKNQGYLLQGGNWNNLGNRFEHAAAADPAKKEELTTKVNECRLKAVVWFAKAEGAIYEQLPLLSVIVRIYAQQGMHDKVRDICGDGIEYWGDSLFTKAYVLQGDAEPGALKSVSLPVAGKTALTETGALKKIQGATDKESLVAGLNVFIEKADPIASKSAFQGILKSAQEGADKNLAANLKQGRALLLRKDLKENRELRQRISRVVLEALYPKRLARSSVMPVLPEATRFDKSIKGFALKYPSTESGRIKAALMRQFHDPRMLLGEDEKKRASDYEKKLQEELKTASTAKRKQDISLMLQLFDPGLRTRVYGILEKGKVQKRNYYAAQRQIDGILLLDESRLPMTEAEVRTVPTKAFLESLRGALEFNQQIFGAQKRYVDALLALSAHDDALKYLEKLVKYYPNDKDLRLRMADAESAKGASFVESKTYGQEQASLFMRARMGIIDLYKTLNKTSKGSPLWYKARMGIWRNELNEITVRHAAGAKDVNYKTDWYRMHRGTRVKVGMATTKELDTQAKSLWNELERFRKRPPAGIEVSDAVKKELAAMIESLKTMGFKDPGGKLEELLKEKDAEDSDDVKPDESKDQSEETE